MGDPTRLAILEALRDGELPVGAILSRLSLEQANLSQHLSVLRTRRLLVNRREGNQVFYSVRDPLLLEVLDIMRRYSMSHLEEDQALLRELKAEDTTP
jgi:ArsR family transcriptional regulator